MARMVRFRVLDGVAVITLEAPPANALSVPLRAGLWEAMGRVNTTPDVKAAVIMAAGPVFSTGVDIRELAPPMAQPTLAQLCTQIENCTKPVIAAAQGNAFGGGAEILLAAHYRIVSPQARIGFGEVNLGLVPGAGGTQRLPRLVGAEQALQMLISGRSIDAVLCESIGLIDAIVQGDFVSGAMTFCQNLIETGQGPRPTGASRQNMKDGRAYQNAVAAARSNVAGTALYAPLQMIDCVEAAALLPFETGLAFEADAFERCLTHPQSIALRHVFVAERRIDAALMARVGGAFKLVDPMGKSTVRQLQGALSRAADRLVRLGVKKAEIDAAMIAYGFRSGVFGTVDAGVENADIMTRLIAALVVEGAACLDRGAVQRPSDIDALAVHGIGFPRRMGGPLRAAQTMGLITLRNQMRGWDADSDIWGVPRLMDDAIKDVRGFDAVTDSRA